MKTPTSDRSPQQDPRPGGELFVVDNSDENWKVWNYLREWTQLAYAFDIATGYFDIGSLLALDGEWQKLDKIRILMGSEVARPTANALLAGAEGALDLSLEEEKERDDFLSGVPAIVHALRSGQIECRIYAKKKFHAKAYITHARQAVLGSFALVGSSNFTRQGLTDNVELNIQIRREVDILQAWYEDHWNEAEDITPEILRVVEKHARPYSPFEIYAKALHEFFRAHEMTTGEWELAGPENGGSRVYPILDQYQREGYDALIRIAKQHRGAFLCDGVGLGKTFVGLMVIERLLFERKRVALFVPKAAREPVWEAAIRRYLPQEGGDFSNLIVLNHTDLTRGGEFPQRLQRVRDMVDAVVIDEAHHFRNPGVRGSGDRAPSRYRRMFDLLDGKQVFMLTATPINNRLIDLQHMIELFSRGQPDYFSDPPLGIHSLAGHFRRMEKDLQKQVDTDVDDPAAMQTNQSEAEQVLTDDSLFRSLVVQRSRAYVRASQLQHGGNQAIFPEKRPPQVVNYSLEETYGPLLKLVETAFSKDKPLFSLAIYYPLAYYKGDDEAIDPFAANRQRQVVGLIRTNFLKRFESSARAFEMSCETLLLKILAFVAMHSDTPQEQQRLERWMGQRADLIERVKSHQQPASADDEEEEDLIPLEMLEAVDQLSRDEYKVEEILAECFLDLQQLAEFLDELRNFDPSLDGKLRALTTLLQSDPVLKSDKVLIFSEYMATARYLHEQLTEAGVSGVDEVDSAVGRDRGQIIKQFAPYYNESSSKELQDEGLQETRVLISTDVLSEGLNLQDATRLINYDLHWNPVRLMQRVGRVDRRLNPEIEAQLLRDHPQKKPVRGSVMYWNFLPPGELDHILKLYEKVSHKTLRISKTFGIEGRQLLTPEDDFEALRDFIHAYEGSTTRSEALHLEYQQLLLDNAGLADQLSRFPNKIFSAKSHPTGGRAVFLCYSLPGRDMSREDFDETSSWNFEAGYTRWYFYDLQTKELLEEPDLMIDAIRSTPETPRKDSLDQEELSAVRRLVEKHIKNTYLKSVQAPVGVKPKLRAWMELS